MGPAGNRSLAGATPHLDSLATEGVTFSNAYSNCPVCNPSRASMFTGQYPHYYDCWNNHEGIRPEIPTLFDVFDASGYRTIPIGPLDYMHGMHSIRDQVGSWTRSAGIERPISRTPVPVVSRTDDFFGNDRRWTDEAVSAIHRVARDDTPSYIYLTTGLVHPAFQAHPRHMEAVDAGAIEIPPTLSDIDATTHPVMRYTRATKHCENRFSEPLVREIRHVYAAMVAAMDELLGQVLEAIRAAGIEEHTWVVFSSDHGEMAGEQNQVLKRTMFEPSIHIPLIIRAPGARSGARFDTPVSLIDLYPTLLEVARIDYQRARGTLSSTKAKLPDSPVGESLVPQVLGDAERKRDWAVAEYHGDRCLTGTWMMRRDRWKYIRYEGFDPQLFDIEADPWETEDLAQSRPEVVTELDALLTDEIDCREIDARAKRYDRASFVAWRETARRNGIYEETMSRVYSGFDRLCIEDIVRWRPEDERQIEEWLERTGE